MFEANPSHKSFQRGVEAAKHGLHQKRSAKVFNLLGSKSEKKLNKTRQWLAGFDSVRVEMARMEKEISWSLGDRYC